MRDVEWTAYLPDFEYDVEPIMMGCRICVNYGVFPRTFGPCGPEPLIRPGDGFLDRLAPVLDLSCGRKIVSSFEFDYSVNLAEALADAVVPMIRGHHTSHSTYFSSNFESSSRGLCSTTLPSCTSVLRSCTRPRAGTSGPLTAPLILSARTLPVHTQAPAPRAYAPRHHQW
ncbi:hypothetical protein FPV67DRAFT_1480956 [Lyophyllum atratum]|nr:hypothetical protein FPV67DRAFT_1480956 [Lyophyllum atratum]